MNKKVSWAAGMMVAWVWGWAVVAGAWPVPDSGQTTCYDDQGKVLDPCPQPGEPFYGQDGNYPGVPRSYTKLDAAGVELPESATEWSVVRDNVTGLEWEAKTTDGSIHHSSNTFTWCDTNPESNGGDAGSCNGNNTEGFIAALNDQNFGGHNDWRLPTIKELYTLVNLVKGFPPIDKGWFPHTHDFYYYWSATTSAGNNNSAWSVWFRYDGKAFSSGKWASHFVRAVRSGQVIDHFQANGDGTVTDVGRGLMWQQASGPSLHWGEALAHGEALELAGYADWRLPAVGELFSLVDFAKTNPAIDTLLFSGTHSDFYWSSTTHAFSYFPSMKPTDNATLVSFNAGGFDINLKWGSGYVRTVRSGQCMGALTISAPAPGAQLEQDTQAPIHWAGNGLGGLVDIEISRQGGKAGTWETLASGVANSGSYLWPVSGPVTVNAMLRVTPLAAPEQASTVGLFSIVTLESMAIKAFPQTKLATYDLASFGIYSSGLGLPQVATWSLSDPGLATISGHTLTAKQNGWVTVTAIFQGKSASQTLFLLDPALADTFESEANNSSQQANPLLPGETMQAEMLAADSDYYAVDLAQPAVVDVGYLSDSKSADVLIEVLNSAGLPLASATSTNGAPRTLSLGIPAGASTIRLTPAGDIDANGYYYLTWAVHQNVASVASGTMDLALGTEQQATLYSLADSLEVTFTIANENPVQFGFTPTTSSGDYTLALRTGGGALLGSWQSENGKQLAIPTAFTPGPYTLTITQAADVDSMHPFTVSLAQASGDLEVEPNNTLAQATPLSQAQAIQALLPADDTDWYSFTLSQPSLVNLALVSQSDTADYRLSLYKAGGDQAIDGLVIKDGVDMTLVTGLASGSYLVKVEVNGASDGQAPYTLGLTTSAVGGHEIEPNDTLEAANGLSPAAGVQGRIFSAGDQDLYGFTLALQGVVAVNFAADSATSADYTVEIINAEGSTITTKTATDGAATTLTMNKAPGTYYLRVKGSGDVDQLATYTVGMTNQGAGSLNLNSGWNLLSATVPVPVATFSDGAKYTSVWKWAGGTWAVFLPGETPSGDYATAKGFGTITDINPGEGFWVNSKTLVSLPLSGTPAGGALTFGQGWNLMGLKGATAMTVVQLTTSQTGIISIWKWDNGTWAVALPGEATPGDYANSKGFTALTTINPGEGFWVNIP